MLGFHKWAYKGGIQYNFAFCFGQNCNDAAAMVSERSGDTSIVQNESPLAYYFYCAVHCLIVNASAAVKVSAIQNADNVARKVFNNKKFNTSAKKMALLKT